MFFDDRSHRSCTAGHCMTPLLVIRVPYEPRLTEMQFAFIQSGGLYEAPIRGVWEFICKSYHSCIRMRAAPPPAAAWSDRRPPSPSHWHTCQCQRKARRRPGAELRSTVLVAAPGRLPTQASGPKIRSPGPGRPPPCSARVLPTKRMPSANHWTTQTVTGYNKA